jgi:hypothetical protein
LTRCNAVISSFGQPRLYAREKQDTIDGLAFHLSIAWTFDTPSEEARLTAVKLFDTRVFLGMRSWAIDVSGLKAKIGNVVTHIPLDRTASESNDQNDLF